MGAYFLDSVKNLFELVKPQTNVLHVFLPLMENRASIL